MRTGKPDFFVEEPMLSTGLHFASESTGVPLVSVYVLAGEPLCNAERVWLRRYEAWGSHYRA